MNCLTKKNAFGSIETLIKNDEEQSRPIKYLYGYHHDPSHGDACVRGERRTLR